MKINIKRWSVIFFIGTMILPFTFRYWCHIFGLFSLDLCWLWDAEYLEFVRAFDNHHRLLNTLILVLKFLAPITGAFIVFVAYSGKNLKVNVSLSLISIMLTLLVSEFGLRKLGFQPGQFKYSSWVHPVDSLYEMKGFVNDEDGILKVNLKDVNTLRHINSSSGELYGEKLDDVYVTEFYEVLQEHWNRQDWDSTIWFSMVNEIDFNDTIFSRLIQHYIKTPINIDGFYSIPFDVETGDHPRILLLGDSFTWGHSSSHKSRSFSNLLLKQEYAVFNTGISGADVQQYELVLKTYFNKIKPDVVVLNFFIGNDISNFKRPVGPKSPLMYHTNAGNIIALQNGIEASNMVEAYGNVMSNMQIPRSSSINSIMASTVVTTYLWEFLVNQGWIDHQYFVGEKFPDESVTNELMAPIIEFCDSMQVPLIVSAIPKLENDQLIGVSSEKGLFDSINYSEPEMNPTMYSSRDGHFNDKGHLFYANYLEKLIEKKLELDNDLQSD